MNGKRRQQGEFVEEDNGIRLEVVDVGPVLDAESSSWIVIEGLVSDYSCQNRESP